MINILIAGDTYPINKNYSSFINGDKNKILNNFAEVFESADFRIVNLECALDDDYSPKELVPVHIINSAILNGVKSIGTDLVCLANNHVYDYGNAGLKNMILKLNEYGLKYAGINDGKDDINHYKIEKDGLTIAVINIAAKENNLNLPHEIGINIPDLTEQINYINKIKSSFDHIIIIAHYGYPGYPLPYPKLQQESYLLINAGVSCIIHQSSHTPGAFEKYNDGLIFYGQGNFIFDLETISDQYQKWNKGFLIKLIFDKKHIGHEVLPYIQSPASPGIQKMNAETEVEFMSFIAGLSDKLKNKAYIESEWEKLAQNNGRRLIAELLSPNPRIRYILRKYKLMDYLSKNFYKALLNLMESHHNNALLSEYLKIKKYEKSTLSRKGI